MSGRPREFDEKQAIEKAMEVFWCRGYEAAGMRELLDAMQISRQSCYNTFGDKRQLFLTTIKHYGCTVVESVCKQLDNTGSPIGNIRELISGAAAQSCRTQQSGCLVLNSIVEFGSQDAEVVQLLRCTLDRVHQSFYKALQRAQEAGEIEPETDPEALAHFLTHVFFGFASLGKLRLKKKMADDIVQLTLNTLRPV